ncbi:hypothetical protein Cni_G13403 [Canna indica]|uniref:DUF4283 domain-containing protein n=1 Tax=Canna indica TaxID=4628 RepID=A0AAQ3QCN5_9LILI|nr:hypothetical protein Cni_G13403 [Canna indica]
MRLQSRNSPSEVQELKDFFNWVLSIGNGTLCDTNDGETHPPSLRPPVGADPRPTASKAPFSWSQVLRGQDVSRAQVPANPSLRQIHSSMFDFMHFSSEQLLAWSSPWVSSLIGKFFGHSPPLPVVNSWASRVFSDKGFILALDLEDGYFVFHFHDLLSSTSVLTGGSYSLRGHALRLIPWRPLFRPWCEVFSSALVWIQFVDLPLELWNVDSISLLARAFGKVLAIDDRSFKFLHGRYVKFVFVSNLICLSLYGKAFGLGNPTGSSSNLFPMRTCRMCIFLVR